MRIRPETRAALEREAARCKRSLSQQVEWLMTGALELPAQLRRHWGAPHIQALAQLIVRAVEGIEASTRRTWRDDPFTGQAARAAINILLERLMPAGPIETPEAVETSAQATARVLPADRTEFYRTPEGVAEKIALGLLVQLETEPPPLEHPRHQYYPAGLFYTPNLRQELKMDKESES